MIFDRIFRETCGFAAIAMIRRCIGVVSVEDLASIKNERIRAHVNVISFVWLESCF